MVKEKQESHNMEIVDGRDLASYANGKELEEKAKVAGVNKNENKSNATAEKDEKEQARNVLDGKKDEPDKKKENDNEGEQDISTGAGNDEVKRENVEDNEEDEEEDEDEDGDEDEDEDEDEDRKFVQPIKDGREIRLNIKDMNEHLVCKLCNGYFREAYTIMECLHTFCKVCLYKYLLTRDDRVGTSRKSDCPTCHIQLPNAEPMRNHIRFDRTKQNIVDLIVPHFKRQPEKRPREESKAKKIEPPEKKMKVEVQDGRKMPKFYFTFVLRPEPNKTKEKSSMKELGKPWLRASPKLTVKHLKRYLKMKLLLESIDELELTCQGELLGMDHNLEFIKKTRWHAKSPLELCYRRVDPGTM
mmetsp:Transcript_19128/g.28612  ORF Transcript_19128/g.28612 Transcript_19128/m.28612 type:complete len:358 (+) Transcript_19128:128-1201(+)